MTTTSLMRRLHFVIGAITTIALFAAGAYINLSTRQSSLAPEQHLLLISRHIYLLAPALVNLVLAVYAKPVSHPRVPRLQWAGTIFIAIASALLILAFLLEPIGGLGRSEISALGIFTLWAGTILHVIAPPLGRKLSS